MITKSCAAIDPGATRGRVAGVDCDGERLSVHEAQRFDTSAAIMAQLERDGLDGWSIDYVLVDAELERIGRSTRRG